MNAHVRADAAARDGSAPVLLDLNKPGEYQGQVDLAHVIDRFVRAMPLEALVARAEEDRARALLHFTGDARELRRTAEMLAVLRFAQKEFVKIRARYGE